MYEIEPIFIIFPILCLLLAKLEKRYKAVCVIAVTVVFWFIYTLSLNGADIESYKLIYDLVSSSETYDAAHGEVGFKLLMRLFQVLGLDYITFRVVLLTVTTAVLFYSISKTSPNFSLSVFFLTSMFTIYTISTYRQYIVIAFSLYWLYKYSRGKKLLAIIGIGVLAFFHVSAILVCGALVIYTLMKNRPFRWCKRLSLTKVLIWIVAAFIFRVLFIYAMRIPSVGDLVYKLTNGYSDGDTSLISVGLLSRLAVLICITVLMCINRPQDKLTVLLYSFYFFGIIFYTMVPFVTFSGRLFNNFHVMSIVLIPLLCRKGSGTRVNVNAKVAKAETNKIYFVLAALIIVAIAVLFNQMLNQSGYTPYMNILFGDELP